MPNNEVIDKWLGSAPYWEKHRDIIRRMFAPITAALVEESQFAPGQSVLDVATGPGEPALSLAAMFGAASRVCGIDPIPGMVEAARRAAVAQGVANATFEVAFADKLPYLDATFDTVISRFGVMFFPSPVDGIKELLRVLRPGGKLAVAAWCSMEKCAFHSVLSRVMKKYVDSPVPSPDAPDAFRFAAQGKLRDVFVEAGATNPTEQLLRCVIEAPISAEEFLRVRMDMSDKFRDHFAAFSVEQRERVTREALDALREYETGAGLSFPTEVWIVSAVR